MNASRPVVTESVGDWRRRPDVGEKGESRVGYGETRRQVVRYKIRRRVVQGSNGRPEMTARQDEKHAMSLGCERMTER